MPAIPRIARAVPRGTVTRPDQGIPVIVCIRWYDGRDTDVPAIATGWTREAVEITWEAPSMGLRTDWVPAADVRRSTENTKPATAEPPSTRGRTGRPRW